MHASYECLLGKKSSDFIIKIGDLACYLAHKIELQLKIIVITFCSNKTILSIKYVLILISISIVFNPRARKYPLAHDMITNCETSSTLPALISEERQSIEVTNV